MRRGLIHINSVIIHNKRYINSIIIIIQKIAIALGSWTSLTVLHIIIKIYNRVSCRGEIYTLRLRPSLIFHLEFSYKVLCININSSIKSILHHLMKTKQY